MADDGSLAFVPGTASGRLVVLDGQGRSTVVAEMPDYHSIRLSTDGQKAAGDSVDGLWVYDLEKGTRLRIADGYFPAWSPDGTQIAHGVGNAASVDFDVAIRAADGTGDVGVLVADDGTASPSSWSPDGQWILVDRAGSGSGAWTFDIYVVSLEGDARAFLATPANEFGAVLSPDGRWVAYQSDQSGQFEVYVEPFPGPGERVAVSSQGGTSPVWGPDGSELYFRQDTALLAVPVDATDTFSVGPPRHVIDGQYWLDPTGHVAFGVFPDGKLLMIDTGQAGEIHVVLNWVEELERLVREGS